MLDEYSNDAQTHCLIAVTVHFLDENFENKHYVLGAKILKKEKTNETDDKKKKKKKASTHSAENMAKLVEEMLEDFGIIQKDDDKKKGKAKIFLILRDGASAVVKLCRLLGHDSAHCFAHRLQLAIKDALKEVDNFNVLLTKIKKLIRKIQKSYKLLDAFKNAQEFENLPERVLQRGIDVRWSSLYQMVNSFVQNKAAIKRLAEENHELPEFLNADWNQAENVRDSLKIFCEATTMIQSRDATISLVIPFNVSLQKHVQSNIDKHIGHDSLNEALLSSLKERLDSYQHDKIILLQIY